MTFILPDHLEKNGILLIEKPRDMTSFGVVSRLRRLIGVRKIGHTGTLDPFAVGLLAICVGRATTVVQFMDNYDKTYRVHICFGRSTDTMDLTGTTVESYTWLPDELSQLKNSDYARIRQAVSQLVGDQLQLPPMYSAVKIDGQPLYKRARAGETIERQARPITIYEAKIEKIESVEATDQHPGQLDLILKLKVSKGTYIRVIADELGRSLGWFAHAAALERLSVGPFLREQALELDVLESWFGQKPDRQTAQDFVWQSLVDSGHVQKMQAALNEWPTIHLSRQEALKLTQGQPLTVEANQLAAHFKDRTAADFTDAAVRYALWCDEGLLGVAHLESVPDAAGSAALSTHYRLVTERIFLSHECLLPL